MERAQRGHVAGRSTAAALPRDGRLRGLAPAAPRRDARADLHLAGARALDGVVRGLGAHGPGVHPLAVAVAGPEAAALDRAGRGAPKGGPLGRWTGVAVRGKECEWTTPWGEACLAGRPQRPSGCHRAPSRPA